MEIHRELLGTVKEVATEVQDDALLELRIDPLVEYADDMRENGERKAHNHREHQQGVRVRGAEQLGHERRRRFRAEHAVDHERQRPWLSQPDQDAHRHQQHTHDDQLLVGTQIREYARGVSPHFPRAFQADHRLNLLGHNDQPKNRGHSSRIQPTTSCSPHPASL